MDSFSFLKLPWILEERVIIWRQIKGKLGDPLRLEVSFTTEDMFRLPLRGLRFLCRLQEFLSHEMDTLRLG